MWFMSTNKDVSKQYSHNFVRMAKLIHDMITLHFIIVGILISNCFYPMLLYKAFYTVSLSLYTFNQHFICL